MPLVILPVTAKLDSVPKLVKLADVIPDARVDPVKFAALAVCKKAVFKDVLVALSFVADTKVSKPLLQIGVVAS